MSESIVKYETDHGEVALSMATVRQYLVSGGGQATAQEVAMFIRMCEYQRLNPFLREAYLIKYGSQPATLVTGKEVFTKRAAKNPRFDGFKAGVTVVNKETGELTRREGQLFFADKEYLVAGWANVYLKQQRIPIYAEAAFSEYAGRKGDGSLNKTWASKPATMIRKVALVQALREAFPEDFQGLYDSAEMGDVVLPEEPVDAPKPLESDASPTSEEVVIEAPMEASESTPEPVEEEATPDVTPEATPDVPEEGSVDWAKALILTTGSKDVKGKTLGEVMELKPELAEWYVTNGKNETLKRAFIVLLEDAKPVEGEVVDATIVTDDDEIPF